MKIIEGKLIPGNIQIGVVASRFNEFIVKRLLDGVVDGLVRHGVSDDNITAAWVPGAFEIPLIAKKMAQSGNYDAVICIGAVIRGETSHYEYICAEVSKGIAQVALESEIPVIFGVLTTDNLEQAIHRAGSKSGNKGYEAALSAIEMIHVIRQINANNPIAKRN
ncbi:MAG: 6,7-dimethyl-8-ribityllumazine synthase [Clostridium sp.]|jgi:6,7-dimethyl-8-ribityllumazine synthase